jgi:deoxyribose-phosphate aldolase
MIAAATEAPVLTKMATTSPARMTMVAGAAYNKSSTGDYGSGGGYNKSSTGDYGSGAATTSPAPLVCVCVICIVDPILKY